MSNNEQSKLTEMEIDVVGEIMNISMGAAATALSSILDQKVSITTPRLEEIPVQDFEFSYLEPVMGVLIKYVEGLDGTNMLLLREHDIRKMLDQLLGVASDPAEELDEIGISAICEIMNQMMGAAASALATFFSKMVNISPPEIMDPTKPENVKELFSLKGESLVCIKFDLNIEDVLHSEFISAMDPQLAKEMAEISYSAGKGNLETVPDGEEEQAVFGQAPMAPEIAMAQPDGGQMVSPQMYPPPTPQPEVHAAPYTYKSLGSMAEQQGEGNHNNLDLIMSVPLQVTVELGRARKKIKDIVDLTVGNIVELDRQAGDHVDIVANGKLIARGDVVVVDDNYSVRITEIVKMKDQIE